MPESFSGRLEYGSGVERRRAPRIPHVVDLSYEILALPDAKTIVETLDRLLEAKTADLSEVGVSLWTNRLLTPGTSITLHFQKASGGLPDVKARVVWCQPHTEGGAVRARLGLEFIDMDPAAREKLVNLVRENGADAASGG